MKIIKDNTPRPPANTEFTWSIKCLSCQSEFMVYEEDWKLETKVNSRYYGQWVVKCINKYCNCTFKINHNSSDETEFPGFQLRNVNIRVTNKRPWYDIPIISISRGELIYVIKGCILLFIFFSTIFISLNIFA